MAKVNKSKLATALLSFYASAEEFNRIGGKPLSKDFIGSQKGVVMEEGKETILAILNNDKKERVDGLGDICFTASFMVMLQDGNNSLTKDHHELFNVDGSSYEVLSGRLLTALLQEDWITVLETAEDLLYLTDEYAIENLLSIQESNMSKYVPVKELSDPEKMCEDIEEQGRYTGVEFNIDKLSSGEEVYVFTATYDTKEKRAFDKPKIVKPEGYFKEPVLKV